MAVCLNAATGGPAAQRVCFCGLSAHLQINLEFSCYFVGIGTLILTEAGGTRTTED